jgi:hypothetical protein
MRGLLSPESDTRIVRLTATGKVGKIGALMVNPEKAAEPNHQTSSPIDETTAPKMPLSTDTLRRMIASGKSVPSKASTK